MYDKENQKFKDDIRDQLKKLEKSEPGVQVDDEWKSSVDESIRTLKARQDTFKSIPDDVYKIRNFFFNRHTFY